MSELSIKLPIFIASPGDVSEERVVAEAVILEESRNAAYYNLQLDPFRWENHGRPGIGRPQDLLNTHLVRSELTVVIFWSKLGSPASDSGEEGTREELRIARALNNLGMSDDVFVYFRTSPAPPGADPKDLEKLRALKKMMEESHSLFYWSYKTPDEFRECFGNHLRSWIKRWERVPEICRNTLSQSSPIGLPASLGSEGRYRKARFLFDPQKENSLAHLLGGFACDIYQEYGLEGILRPLPPNVSSAILRSPNPSVHSIERGNALNYMGLITCRELQKSLFFRLDDSMYFWGLESLFFFCGIGLLISIQNDDFSKTTMKPYINEIHQYLKGGVGLLHVERKTHIVTVLRKWLKECHGEPIARNFAAYALGMINAYEASDDLARAAQFDDGEDVRRYCITSLGKLRSRKYLDLLVDLYHREEDASIKLQIGQSICRIVGVAEFEL